MIQHLVWEKKKSPDKRNIKDIYTIQSKKGSYIFALKDGEFAVIGYKGAVRCSYEEMPIIAKEYKDCGREIMDIYREIPDLVRLNII